MDGWKLTRLVHDLRQVSIVISTQDIIEAQTCFTRFPEISEKEILKALFIHRIQDLPTFEMVWRILMENPELLDQKPSPDHAKVPPVVGKQVSPGVGGLGEGSGSGGTSLTAKGTVVEAEHISRLIPYARLEELAGSGLDFEDQVAVILKEMDYHTWINSYDLAYRRGELSEEKWYAIQAIRSALILEIRHLAMATQVNHRNSWQPVVKQHWLYKPLSSINEREKALVKSSIKKWARKLALRPGLRWKTSRRGTIDLSRIVQQSVSCDGVLMRLSYRQRIPSAPELVVLCDVSNSMASYVEFFMYLVSCLRARFRKIHLYFFIDSIWDISDSIREAGLADVKQEIESWGYKGSSGFSDYGTVFKEFAENKLNDISLRSNLIILGDGKNNYRPAQPEYLAMISEKVKSIVWLNPLEFEEWQDRDNTMKEYQPYCSKVYRCRSASDFQRIVHNVFGGR